MLRQTMHSNFRRISLIQHCPWSPTTAADGSGPVYQPRAQWRVACGRRSEVFCSTAPVVERCNMPRLWHRELLFVLCGSLSEGHLSYDLYTPPSSPASRQLT